MKVDIALAYELAKFNGEVTPKRRLCDKGVGVFGEFTLYMPMKDYTCADFFQSIEETIPVFFRFARVTDLKSNADSLRDFRTMGARFFNENGYYDLLSGSAPIFFINEINKLPELLNCLKPEICRDLTNYTEFWEFIGNNPETTYMLLWLFSGRGTVKSYRNMCFYSINTYLWTNEKGKSFFVRYEWSPMSDIKYITRQESEFLAGFDPNVAIRDLSDALENNKKVEFELNVQLVPVENEGDYSFDLLDTTKEWPKATIESLKIGKVSVLRMAELSEERDIQLNPRNLVRGIDLTQCKLLHAMCVAITDEQRQRLGNSFKEPVMIKPQNEMKEQSTVKSQNPSRIQKVENTVKNKEDFLQAGKFYNNLSDSEKNAVIENILDSIMFVENSVLEKVVDGLTKVDEELGAVISMGLDL